MEFVGRNVNHVWPQAMRHLKESGKTVASRNGDAVEWPEPVVTKYEQPQERVLFDADRDANPFLHLFEALWIIAGRNDVAWPAQFAKQVKEYSDDGKTFHAAYGYRLRASGRDQVDLAVKLLKEDPSSRRVALQIWDASLDLGHAGKDIPCNTMLFLKIRENQLHITVCNRSNDIIWGLYGANVVQWSMLQEYLAARIGCHIGPMVTLSDSFHAYTGNKTWQQFRDKRDADCWYENGTVCPYPLVDVPHRFDEDLNRFLADPVGGLDEMFPKRTTILRNSFFWVVAQPMYAAWKAHKENRNGAELLRVQLEEQRQNGQRLNDWIMAGYLWLKRRECMQEPGNRVNDTSSQCTPGCPEELAYQAAHEAADACMHPFSTRLKDIAKEDAAGLLRAYAKYGDSWRKRGGGEAYHNLTRKWDRIERAVEATSAPDLFLAIRNSPASDGTIGGKDGLLDDIRDLRRYLLLVEEYALRDSEGKV